MVTTTGLRITRMINELTHHTVALATLVKEQQIGLMYNYIIVNVIK